jgi:hypothetical protein
MFFFQKCVVYKGSGDMKVMQLSVQTGKKLFDLQVRIVLDFLVYFKVIFN